jgi:hypothetical protein
MGTTTAKCDERGDAAHCHPSQSPHDAERSCTGWNARRIATASTTRNDADAPTACCSSQ